MNYQKLDCSLNTDEVILNTSNWVLSLLLSNRASVLPDLEGSRQFQQLAGGSLFRCLSTILTICDVVIAKQYTYIFSSQVLQSHGLTDPTNQWLFTITLTFYWWVGKLFELKKSYTKNTNTCKLHHSHFYSICIFVLQVIWKVCKEGESQISVQVRRLCHAVTHQRVIMQRVL